MIFANPELNEFESKGQYLNFRGYSIFYRVIGTGENIFLLHGYPFNSYDWSLVIPELSKEKKIILLDFLGMGFSDKPQNYRYTFEEYAEIVNEVAKHLNIVEADILAHDLAVSVVQEMLASPEKNKFQIRSIAFMNGGLFIDVYKPRLIQRLLSQTPNAIGRFLSNRMSRKSVENSLLRLFGRDTKPNLSLLNILWEVLNYKKGKSIAYLIGRMVFEKVHYQNRWIEAMLKTGIPFCYICGPADPNSGRHMANRFTQTFPNKPVYFLSEMIGHWPQIESPNEVTSMYYQFQNYLKDLNETRK
ncbi:alpha/beta hydrolase [Leptospira sp. 2 VSF19]|uniref:Alpha/beta hydrolase n=1 Tax=Leptospira soteropolitanensis TaxID=2950025 RepID=A0AAW5VL21_9LEPT|nr:alpha/beta hydrolase [Leptospira soteropolitanensis]MCW7494289.1 alpha/beta hydrolase [Leptospira soteropolitanensis]MCW7502002.1 alpha/beta hydrolase [Leptospira soteropolitanensis]MCW7524135.1 alpha/beta hydrolase [Leptospira soteropolitanensis]MCW7528000.1 alpha/beta hydrolase [Leptospira soteropolitanensis]MCW7531854.1 alpha/beta hydrolase [Leptospira soteropolitanensis]